MNTMTEAKRLAVIGRQKMTPSEAFVETLVAQGVKDVFGIVGSAYMDALDLFALAGIRFISVAHEQGAGHMADGYARVSGRHGVCIAQNGPGVTNFVTSTAAAAYWAHSPVVIVTPETGSMTLGLGGFRKPSGCRSFEDHEISGARQQPGAHGGIHRPRIRPRAARDGTRPAQHSPRLFLLATSNARSRGRWRSSAVQAASRAWRTPPSFWPRRSFP
jgi:hypothetical protein